MDNNGETAGAKSDEISSNSNDKTLPTEDGVSLDDGTDWVINVEFLISSLAWRDDIIAKCSHEGKMIGLAVARFINRSMITEHFWKEMDKCSPDAGEIAWTIFSRYGFFLDKFMSHPVHRGTGVWGSELDDGPLFLIEQVYISDAEWRGKGVERAIVRELLLTGERCLSQLSDTQQSNPFHAIVIPRWDTEDVQPQHVDKSTTEKNEINVQARKTAISFYRSLGFRRIGSSQCFAYSFNPNHRARSIDADMDFDPEVDPGREDRVVPHAAQIQLGEEALSKLKEEFPLHHAATTLPDLECLEYLKKAAAENKTQLAVVDSTRRTLLHTLARKIKPESMMWLLTHVDAAESWKTTRDINGDTPLDVLKDILEDIRTKRYVFNGPKAEAPAVRTKHVSDQFLGWPSPVVKCLSLLDTTYSGEDLGLSISRLTYGCTCGQCIDGFLSPRMKMALLERAQTLHLFLSDDIEDGRLWVKNNNVWLRDLRLPRNIKRHLKTIKSFRQGYVDIFFHVRDCLVSDLAPTVNNVLQAVRRQRECSPAIRILLARAGDFAGIKATLTCIISEAQFADDRTGGGEFQSAYATEYSSLKVCRNDREFKFVARACGINPNRW